MKFPGVKALTFDVGGTVFDWRGAIEIEVQRISDEQSAGVDVQQFATDWRVRMFEQLGLVKSGDLPRMNADGLHRRVLDEILDKLDTLELSVTDRDDLNQVWHRMKTWPGAVDAIHKLRGAYTTTVLTVMSYAIAVDCSKLNGLSWDGIMSCEFMDRYKTDPEAYQQAAMLLGQRPDEVMMVAAHAPDLMGAKNAGLKTAYIHVEEEWIDVFPTPEPIHPVDNFDVSALSWAELVEKLT
jgi:2-haloacid dehalogenase